MNAVTATTGNTEGLDSTLTNLTFANLVSRMGEVTSKELDTVKSLSKNLSVGALALSVTKTENKAQSLFVNYAQAHKAVGQALIHGQLTPLHGLATAKKSSSGAFEALVTLGVCDPSGGILIGVDKSIQDKKAADVTWSELQAEFIAHLWAERENVRLARLEAKKAEKEKAEAEAEAGTTPEADTALEAEAETALVALSEGQKDDEAVSRIIARFTAGALSNENIATLLATLAPHGVKPAPKVKTVKS